MARKEEPEGPEEDFKVPDFDEDQFIHKEMVSFRTTAILFVWGILAALVSWGVFALLDGHRAGWFAGLAIVAAFGFALRYLFPRLGADIRHFGRREWAGTGFLFFFTWLAFFILLTNPPVGDFAPPRVDAVVTPPVQQAGSPVAIDLFYADNSDIAEHRFELWRGDGDARQVIAATGDLTHVAGGHWAFRTDAALPAGLYHLRASATDPNGKFSEDAATFTVSSQALDYVAPEGGVLDHDDDHVRVAVHPDLPPCESRKAGKQRIVTGPDGCVRDVRLVRADGAAVHLKWSAEKGKWEASAAAAGWSAGNNTFRVEAETADTFEHFTRVNGTTLALAGPFSVDVRVATGTSEAVVPLDPAAPVRSVPGPALPLVALAILAALLAARRETGPT